VRRAGLTQSLSYPLRLPDEAQTDALRLLDVSREVIKAVKPLSYMGSGSALRLPSMVPRSHLLHAGKIYVNGWRNAVKLHSSYVTETMLRLCG
jgi:hypothetical protein